MEHLHSPISALKITQGVVSEKVHGPEPPQSQQQHPREAVHEHIQPIYRLHADGSTQQPPKLTPKVWSGKKRGQAER